MRQKEADKVAGQKEAGKGQERGRHEAEAGRNRVRKKAKGGRRMQKNAEGSIRGRSEAGRMQEGGKGRQEAEAGRRQKEAGELQHPSKRFKFRKLRQKQAGGGAQSEQNAQNLQKFA